MRGVFLPTTENSFSAMTVSLTRTLARRRRFLGRRQHRLDLAVVVAAAAQVARQPAPHLGLRGISVLHEQRLSRHDLFRGAEAALPPVVLDEGLLDRVELVALGQPLDGEDLLAVHPDRELAARIDIAPADDDRAGAALAAVAADARAGEPELVAENFRQRLAVLDFQPVGLAVDL